MHLSDIQDQKKKFEVDRGWDEFTSSEVFVHLVEEIGEIGRCILYDSGYKKTGLGHKRAPKDVDREFAQSLSLLIQLANRQRVDLESAYLKEFDLMKERFPAKRWKTYTMSLGRRARNESERNKKMT